MSRIYDFTLIGVITLISFIVHTVAIELFGPQSSLHKTVAQAGSFSAASRTDLWFEIIAVWAPMIAIGGIICWAVIREWRRQVTTQRVPSPR